MRIVYSKDNCPGCQRLIEEYDREGMLEGRDYKVLKLGTDITVDRFLELYPNAKGVPFVIPAAMQRK